MRHALRTVLMASALSTALFSFTTETNTRGHEIATRILEREAQLVARIQARWRGLSVRRYLVVFRRELRRHREVRVSMIYRIQRAVRGWSHRKRACNRRLRRAAQSIGADYLAERKAGNDDDACTEGMARLRKAYIKERCVMMMSIHSGILWSWGIA